jgi:hypothetical protein
MMRMRKPLALTLLNLMIISGLLMLGSCGGLTWKVTPQEVEQLIKDKAPVGSSVSQVESFVNTLAVNGIKATTSGFSPYPPQGTQRPQGEKIDASGYLVAGMKKAGHDHSKFQVYNITMTFYFGADGRLIDYKLETLGDW